MITGRRDPDLPILQCPEESSDESDDNETGFSDTKENMEVFADLYEGDDGPLLRTY